jgi:hypothetical protein
MNCHRLFFAFVPGAFGMACPPCLPTDQRCPVARPSDPPFMPPEPYPSRNRLPPLLELVDELPGSLSPAI